MVKKLFWGAGRKSLGPAAITKQQKWPESANMEHTVHEHQLVLAANKHNRGLPFIILRRSDSWSLTRIYDPIRTLSFMTHCTTTGYGHSLVVLVLRKRGTLVLIPKGKFFFVLTRPQLWRSSGLQWRPGSNWGFSVLLKDTSTWTMGWAGIELGTLWVQDDPWATAEPSSQEHSTDTSSGGTLHSLNTDFPLQCWVQGGGQREPYHQHKVKSKSWILN